MSVRAKFRCVYVQKDHADHGVVHFQAVTSGSEENESYWKYTPWGELKMGVDNPQAFEKFEEGREYYLELIPTEPA